MTQRIQEKCKVNRVHLEFVPPFDTSRKCSRCHNIDNESRHDELYKCVKCGYEIDADNNASTNIRSRGLKHVGSVPSPAEQKRVKDECLSLANFT